MSLINNSNISFGVGQKDLPAIKKACDLLSHKFSDKCLCRQAVDFVEIGDKVYLATYPNKGKPLLKVNLTSNGVNSYTYINTESAQQCRQFLKSNKAVKVISDIVDSLKNAAQKAVKRESYID